MIMKGRRNQANKRPGLEFCDFRLEKKKLERKAYFCLKIGFLFEFRSFKRSKIRTRGSFLMKNELLARLSHLKKALKSKGPKVEREA